VALGAADAATRMGVRRHPVVTAAILSNFVVRAIEIAAAINRGRHGNLDRPLIRTLAYDLGCDLDRAREYALARHLKLGVTRSISRTLDLVFERSRVLDRVCAQGVAGRLDISPTEGLAEALLDGALDDFTSADLAHTSLADADLTGVRWSLSGTIWPLGTDVKALLARSEEVEPGGGVLVVTRRGMVSPFAGQAPVL
jgi:hypothetical protein